LQPAGGIKRRGHGVSPRQPIANGGQIARCKTIERKPRQRSRHIG